jgi:hypothetical protein
MDTPLARRSPEDLPADVCPNVEKLRALTFAGLKEHDLLKKLGGAHADGVAAVRYALDHGLIARSEADGVFTYASAVPVETAREAEPRGGGESASRHQVPGIAAAVGPAADGPGGRDAAVWGRSDGSPAGDGARAAAASAGAATKPLAPPDPPAAPVTVPIDSLGIDEEIQPRDGRDDETVASYRRAVEDGTVFPPVLVFRYGGRLFLVDGFHRVAAHREAGATQIRAVVRDGTLGEAALAAVRENLRHGLPLKAAEKRGRLVKCLRADAEYRRTADFKRMGRDFGLDPKTCQAVWAEEFPGEERDALYETKDGTRKRVGDRTRKGQHDRAAPRGPAAADVRAEAGVVESAGVGSPAGGAMPLFGEPAGEFDPCESATDGERAAPPECASFLGRIEDLRRQAEGIGPEDVEAVTPTAALALAVGRLVEALQGLQVRLGRLTADGAGAE